MTVALVDELVAGDSLSFRTSVPDFLPTAGYALRYRLVPRGAGSAQVLVATADGDEYVIAVPASTTANWTPGAYSWHAYVTNGADRFTVGTGQITIRPDPATVAAGTDTRTQAEKALQDAKTALAAWTPTKRQYSIGDVSMVFNSAAEIVKVIEYWQAEVASEQASLRLAQGLKNPARIWVRASRV